MDLLSNLNPNTLILAIMVLVITFGVAMGRRRLLMLVLSTFVGMVLASQLSPEVVKMLPGVAEMQVRVVLLVLPIVLFGLFSGGAGKHHHKGCFLLNLIAGIVTGALIISAFLFVMPPQDLANATNDSLFAAEIINFRLAILGLAPVAVLLTMMSRGEHKKH